MVRRRYYTIEWSPTRQGKNATTVAVAAAASSLLLLHITHTVEELLDTYTFFSLWCLDSFVCCCTWYIYILSFSSISVKTDKCIGSRRRDATWSSTVFLPFCHFFSFFFGYIFPQDSKWRGALKPNTRQISKVLLYKYIYIFCFLSLSAIDSWASQRTCRHATVAFEFLLIGFRQLWKEIPSSWKGYGGGRRSHTRPVEIGSIETNETSNSGGGQETKNENRT